jgi:hypothetical protein
MTLLQYKGGIYDGPTKSVKRKQGKNVYYKDRIPHGKGTYTFVNDVEYSGDFRNGLEHGAGKLTWADGTTFSGTFRYGRPEAKLLKAFHDYCTLKGKVMAQQGMIEECKETLSLQQTEIEECKEDILYEQEKSMAIAVCLDKSQERVELLYNLGRSHGADISQLNAIRYGS